VVTENSKVVASRNRSKHKEAEGNISERLGSEKMKKNTSDNVEERRSISSRPDSSNSGEDDSLERSRGKDELKASSQATAALKERKRSPTADWG